MKNLNFYLSILFGVMLTAISACSDSEAIEPTPKFVITFDSQGGNTIQSQTVEEGTKVSEPTAPIRDNFVFEGWYKEVSCLNSWNFSSDIVTSNITLYAKWLPVNVTTYLVIFNSQGGSEVNSQAVIEGNKVILPTAPLLYRNDLVGWYKEEACENLWNFDSDVVTSDITLYAQWKDSGYPGCVFMATTGSDDNDGTINRPFATLGKAKSIIDVATNAIDTLYIRGGTYNIGEDQIMDNERSTTWSYVFDFSATNNTRSGSNSKRICYWNFNNEKPIFNMSAIRPGKRVLVFYMARSYYHFKGFDIIGTQVSVTGHTQSECFRNDGANNCIYENIAMHDGMAIGFYLVRGQNNLVLNCDAYNNYDNYSQGITGGNVDGFGGHPNATGTGNVFRGCRAWWNSDDGFDLINAHAAYVIENCWSFYNGYQPGTFDSAGDGSGFKSGGYGMSENPSVPTTIPVHVVKGCLAYRNKNQGFYANHHLGGIEWYNNTGYYNPSNFNMLNRKSAAETIDDPEGGYDHVLKNNLSYAPRTTGANIISINISRCTLSNNSFLSNPEMGVTANDFITVAEADASQLMTTRKADGSLPDIDFLKPRSGSQLIGAGIDLGLTFTGTTLGCFQ